MYEWQKQIQYIVDEIDIAILQHKDENMTLEHLSQKLGYSTYYTTRKFKEIAGLSFREYLHARKLAFALKEVRDCKKRILDIAIDYGFSSHEAFTRAFQASFGIAPSVYRRNPTPLILRAKLHAFDRYLFGLDEIGRYHSKGDVKIYFVRIPAHKFMYIVNYESNGYWDFWEKQNQIPGQDFDTICGLFDSIQGKLDDAGGSEANSSGGQIMAYINDSKGRMCDWGYLRSECWGVRLPMDYTKEVPAQMQIMEVPESEYIVFEHGPFDYEQENRSVEARIEKAMAEFSYEDTGYCLDFTPGRVFYFFYNPSTYSKYIRPIRKAI